MHADAVPRLPCAAAPPEELGLPVMLLLTDTECVLEVESEPELEALAVRETQLLAEEHCDPDRVAHWLAVRLPEPLPLRVPEGVPEAVPR